MDPVGQKWRATMRKRNLIPFLKIVIKKGDQQQLEFVFCCCCCSCYYTHTQKWNQPYFATICQMDTRLVDIILHNLASRGIRRLLLRKRLAGTTLPVYAQSHTHLLRLWPLPFCQLCSNWIANDTAPSVSCCCCCWVHASNTKSNPNWDQQQQQQKPNRKKP